MSHGVKNGELVTLEEIRDVNPRTGEVTLQEHTDAKLPKRCERVLYLRTLRGKHKQLNLTRDYDSQHIERGLCMTCTKFQGSEWPIIVYVVEPGSRYYVSHEDRGLSPWTLCSDKLYTTYTRAQRQCVIVCGSVDKFNVVPDRRTGGSRFFEPRTSEDYARLERASVDVLHEIAMRAPPNRINAFGAELWYSCLDGGM